jgi:predicted RNA binding protein YcfA (HicA-like mRNA interferase family)
MTPRTSRMTAQELEKLLADHGFILVSQEGSHRKWRHHAKGLLAIVPLHRKGKVLPIGTLRFILKNAEIPRDEWLNL